MKASSKHLSVPLLLSAWSVLAGSAIAESIPPLVEVAEQPALEQEAIEPETHNTPLPLGVEVAHVPAADAANSESEAIAYNSETESGATFKTLEDLSPAETSAQALQPQSLPALLDLPTNNLPTQSPLTLANFAVEGMSEQSVQLALEPIADDPLAQVNNVFELQDVNPGDWAYEALQNLVSRYDCIEGYPDGTFRGDRALTRYEFAAALNACWQVMERTLIEVGDRFATQDDLDALNRLMAEFEAELTALNTQVDDLEGRVDILEDNQFSTTSKLFGQVIVGLQGQNSPPFQLAGGEINPNNDEVFLTYTAQLSLFTQFSPRSLLFTSFAAGNGRISEQFNDGIVNFTRLAFVSGGNNPNAVSLTDLNYRHLFGRNFAVMVGPQGISPTNVFRGTNRIESAGSGPLSSFAQRNPILAIGSGSGGLGVDWQISSDWSVQGVYAAQDPADTTNGGLFGGDGTDGSTTFGMQLVYSPTLDWDITLQYINNYSPIGRLLTGIGDSRLVVGNTAQAFNLRAPIQTNALGFGTELRISPDITFGGWAGYTTSNYLVAPGLVNTFNWMAFLGFPDLGGEGNLGAIYFGQPPRITNSTIVDPTQARNIPTFFTKGDLQSDAPGGQPGTSYHIEGFYRIQLTDNISITPGVVVVLDPLHNQNNDTIVIGALRTTFSF